MWFAAHTTYRRVDARIARCCARQSFAGKHGRTATCRISSRSSPVCAKGDGHGTFDQIGRDDVHKRSAGARQLLDELRRENDVWLGGKRRHRLPPHDLGDALPPVPGETAVSVQEVNPPRKCVRSDRAGSIGRVTVGHACSRASYRRRRGGRLRRREPW